MSEEKKKKKSPYSLKSYKANKENPFINDALEVINNNIVKKYKNSTNTGEKAILKAIDNHGEVLGHTSFVRQIEIDEDKFAKIYLSNFSAFWDLKNQAIKVFGYIMTQLLPKQDMFIFLIEDCMKHTGYKSKNSVWIGLGSLVENGIIARGPADTLYFINPMVVFNGDRVTFAKTYVKKRKQKVVDPNQTSLLEQISKETE
ncbi:MAG: replication/maintenance protein RepL [Flavobacteriales bacterium]